MEIKIVTVVATVKCYKHHLRQVHDSDTLDAVVSGRYACFMSTATFEILVV